MTSSLQGLGSLFSQAQQSQQFGQQNPFSNQFGAAGGFVSLYSPLALRPCNPPKPLSPIEELEEALARTSYEHWVWLGGGATFSEWRHS